MAESVQTGLVKAIQVAREAAMQRAPNGVRYAAYGDTSITAPDLARMVQAVPVTIAGALARKAYYFVPLAMSNSKIDLQGENRNDLNPETTMIASAYTAELGDQAICHRNVTLDDHDGVFISTRLLSDRFALAFEFFINIGHAFVDQIGRASCRERVWR